MLYVIIWNSFLSLTITLLVFNHSVAYHYSVFILMFVWMYCSLFIHSLVNMCLVPGFANHLSAPPSFLYMPLILHVQIFLGYLLTGNIRVYICMYTWKYTNIHFIGYIWKLNFWKQWQTFSKFLNHLYFYQLCISKH